MVFCANGLGTGHGRRQLETGRHGSGRRRRPAPLPTWPRTLLMHAGGGVGQDPFTWLLFELAFGYAGRVRKRRYSELFYRTIHDHTYV
jgi:hypothetical protein